MNSHPVPSIDWSDLTDYETLIKIPEVREQIAQYAARATKCLSGEQFLEHCDRIFSPLFGGVSTAGIAGFCQPMTARLGMACTKTDSRVVAMAPGRAIVRILCSLAERNHRINSAIQCPQGCRLEATIPSDIWSFEGELTINVERQGQGTHVEAIATIKGQKFDWGKSRRCLDQLFADLQANAQAA